MFSSSVSSTFVPSPGAGRAVSSRSRKNVFDETRRVSCPAVPRMSLIGGDHRHLLLLTMLGGQALDEGIGLGREANRRSP